MNKRILVICTGNACRSQMAEGFLRSFDDGLRITSAGTNPAPFVHPLTVSVMKEVGVDISDNSPKSVERYLFNTFDYVITLCDNAKEVCPDFTGQVKQRLHFGFEDPVALHGTHEEKLDAFRKTRDEIKTTFESFYKGISTTES